MKSRTDTQMDVLTAPKPEVAELTVEEATGILNRTSAKCAIKAIHLKNVWDRRHGISVAQSRAIIGWELESVNDLLKGMIYSPNQFRHAFAELHRRDWLIERGNPSKGWHRLAADWETTWRYGNERFPQMPGFGAKSLDEFFYALELVRYYRVREESEWINHDGGLAESPLLIRTDPIIGGVMEGERGDCVLRAIAIALEIPYKTIWTYLYDLRKESGNLLNSKYGVHIDEYLPFLIKNGWARYTFEFKPHIAAEDINLRLKYIGWNEPYIIQLHGHVSAVRNNIFLDNFNPTGCPVQALYAKVGNYERLRKSLGLLID